ncbi:MAG: hypothetical protein GXZ05_09830 [Gammaproteobacteria bacterium]|nr:hypothetical protein [Gammaproteobacteria bacterium]
MRYLKYTYVDAVTGVPITDAPARNGPAAPAVGGLAFGFALESLYPAAVPVLYGTCPDGVALDVPGVIAELTEAEYTSALDAEMISRLERARVDATAANNAAYEQAIALMTADYPPAEIQTWERQRAEALAWNEDASAETPWIDLAALARGLDREEYLVRTLAKVSAFAQASAWLTGRRQGIDDAIRAATSAVEVRAVVIDYALPGGFA